MVNEFGETASAHVYACGDCTNHPNKGLNARLRLESVHNAMEQSKTVANTIMGKKEPYDQVPWFWSDQYDLKLQIAGLSQGYDQMIIRGDHNNGRSFAAFYLKQGQLISADCVNRPQEFMLSKRIINEGLVIDINKLADESIPPKELLNK